MCRWIFQSKNPKELEQEVECFQQRIATDTHSAITQQFEGAMITFFLLYDEWIWLRQFLHNEWSTWLHSTPHIPFTLHYYQTEILTVLLAQRWKNIQLITFHSTNPQKLISEQADEKKQRKTVQ